MSYNPISQDPQTFDSDYPATMDALHFDSHGAMLTGIMYRPQGAGPHPTILLLHGFPGHERNFDLAQIFRRAGYNVVVFHYRGAWGSEGDFAFKHVLDDTETAIHYLCQPEITTKYHIDTQHIIVIGHSMGGWAALHVAGKGLVSRVASIAGANIGLWGEMITDSPESRIITTQAFDESAKILMGATGKSLVDEAVQCMDEFDVMRLAKSLSQLDVLLIGGEDDEIVPLSLNHSPLVTMIEKQSPKKFTHVILDSDHSFNNKRIELAKVILDWLNQ